MKTIIMKMLKDQNVNKKKYLIILCTLFIVFSIKSFSQEKLEGKYGNLMKNQDSFNYIIFNLDGTFEYENGSDLGDRELYGAGEYKIENGFLILNYNKSKPFPSSYFKKSVWENNKDSITIQFHVYDMKGNPISNASLYFENHKEKPSGGETNKMGFFIKKIKKNNRYKINIIVSDINSIGSELLLTRNYNYDLRFYLANINNGIPIVGQIDSLKMKEIKDNNFKIYTKDNKVETWIKLKN